MAKEKQAEKKENKIDMQLYVEFQMLNQQLKEIQQSMQTMEQQANEIAVIRQALEDLKDVKQGTEMLAPIAPGIFVKAKLEDNSGLLINVGGKVVVPKTVEEAQNLLMGQQHELAGAEQNLAVQFQQTVERMHQIQDKLKP
ncbi:prefoldin subunit alpha [Candidatus Woesearchaeota archaeon]|nr:prefoldin subunit alpha [Candidatus Woesearchaeota archaeon]MBW3016924.1 prefoldin subunit alpha [Candidatus Woesearchaeota archaeon]